MKYQTESLNGGQILRLEGDLIIENAGELKDIFVNLLKCEQPIALKLDGVETAHVACLQVICSSHRTFWTSGLSLKLEGYLPPLFSKVIEESGFSRDKGCSIDSSHTCIFAAGGK